MGVAPPGFRGLKNDHFSHMWLPAASFAIAKHVSRDGRRPDGADRIFEEFVGRLADNVDLEQARAELGAAARLLTGADPEGIERFRSLDVRVQLQPGMSFSGPNTRNEIAVMIALFTGGGVLLLLLAGANVGNLLLFRGARRRDELAMRAVLGASRWRLLRAHLIDVSLLSLLGGAVGLGLTWTLSRLLDGLILPEAGFLNLPIDWRVGGLVLAGAMGVGIVFGGAPVVVASSPGSLALAARSGHHRGRRLRSALTVLQLALSLSLLVGAALLLATIRNLAAVDIGFDPARVVSASLLPGENGYDDARALGFYRDLLDRAAASPAVISVSVSGGAPIVGSNLRERVYLPGRDPAQAIAVRTNSVTTDYFPVLGVPVLHGRAFADQEVFARPDDTCGPVIVSETLAQRLFGIRDVVGRVLVLPRTPAPMQCHVIGVAGDVRTSPGADWEATLYRPLGRSPLLRRASVLARSSGPTPLAIGALREAAAAIDGAIPLHLPRSLADAIEFALAGQRIISSVLASVAALGLLMAAVGLYGLVAETVVDRTRELAIRMIVGAEPRSIFVTVMRRAMSLAAMGTAAGIVLSAGLSQALRSQLFGVTTVEPWVYASVTSVLAATVLLASLAPAVRAVRVNPMDALRAE
jgi:putative ABC transport system permease protein